MGTKGTKNGKRGSKARRKALRRQRMIRRGVIYGGIALVCVAVLMLIPKLAGRGSDLSTQGRDIEIAAPAMSGTGLTTAGGSFTTAGGRVSGDEGGALDLPDIPTRATAKPTAEPTAEPTAIPTATPEPAPTTITITAAGDCTFGGCLKHDTLKVFKKYVDSYGYDYFFDKVRHVFQADDLTVINLEGPLTDVGSMTTKSGICFCGSPDWTGIMTGSSVELCNMANNHSMDMGLEGMNRTAQALSDAGIGYCGYTKAYHKTIKGVRITALGFDKWNNNKEQIVEAIKKERPDCDLLIVNMHWGFEMHYEVLPEQREWGHAAVDAGADLIIGTHPHVFGGVEQYKGKYIVYSLGNFCFGGNTVPSDQRCLMFQQTFQVSPSGQVSDGGINVIPCLVSGDKKKNDFQPYILGEQPGKSLLKNVARYSNLNKKTLWMQNSYPEQIGLITADNRVSTVPSSSGAAVATSADAAAQDTALTTAAQAAQDDAWEDATDSAWEDATSDGGQESSQESGQLVGEFMASDDAMTRLRIFEDQIGN